MKRSVVGLAAALFTTLVAVPAFAEDVAPETPASPEVAPSSPASTPDAAPASPEGAPASAPTPDPVAAPPPPPPPAPSPPPPPATAPKASINTNSNSGPAKSEKADEEGRDPNAKEHFRIGPLVGVGFPRPLAVEGLVKIERVVGLGVEYSFLPKVNLFGAETSFKAVAADLRVFPFKGSFFIGARAGRQWLDAKTTMTVGQGGTTVGSFTEAMEASTWFVNPRIGFLKTWDSGITLGIDAGVQFPINPTYERSGPATTAGVSSAGVDDTLRGVAGALGNNITPTIDMLRLGFMF